MDLKGREATTLGHLKDSEQSLSQKRFKKILKDLEVFIKVLLEVTLEIQASILNSDLTSKERKLRTLGIILLLSTFRESLKL